MVVLFVEDEDCGSADAIAGVVMVVMKKKKKLVVERRVRKKVLVEVGWEYIFMFFVRVGMMDRVVE